MSSGTVFKFSSGSVGINLQPSSEHMSNITTQSCDQPNVLSLMLQPPAKGAFLRGSGMDQSTGRFTAPITGIYQFSANVHIGK